MEIKFQGRYDKSLFFKSVRLANRPVGSRGRYLAIMLVFALIAVGILIYRVLETGDFVGNAILIIAAVALGCIVALVYLQPYFSARKMWSNPGTRRELKGQVTNRGIVYNLKGGQNEIHWERFSRIRKTGDVVTLVRKDGLLVIFPRRFFKRDADWRRFNKLASSKVTISD
jgi:hypothetical protein